MEALKRFLLIFLGSGLGGVIRFLLGSWIAEHTTTAFPWNTLVINATGSYLIGVVMGYLLNTQAPVALRYLLVVGFLGGIRPSRRLASKRRTYSEHGASVACC